MPARRPRGDPPPAVSPAVPAVRAPPEVPRDDVPALPPVQDVPAWGTALAAYPGPPASLDAAQRRLYGEILCQLCKDEKVALVVYDALECFVGTYVPRKVGHRGKVLTPAQVRGLQQAFAQGRPLEVLMREYRLSKASVYRYLREP